MNDPKALFWSFQLPETVGEVALIRWHLQTFQGPHHLEQVIPLYFQGGDWIRVHARTVFALSSARSIAASLLVLDGSPSYHTILPIQFQPPGGATRIGMDGLQRAAAETSFLLSRSSLGSPEARAIRESDPPETVSAVLERVRQLDHDSPSKPFDPET